MGSICGGEVSGVVASEHHAQCIHPFIKSRAIRHRGSTPLAREHVHATSTLPLFTMSFLLDTHQTNITTISIHDFIHTTKYGDRPSLLFPIAHISKFPSHPANCKHFLTAS